MNKKLLIFSSTIIIILLACFVIAEISRVTFNTLEEDDIISGVYLFNSTVDYNSYGNTNVTFYYNISELEQIYLCNCTNKTIGQILFNCTNDTTIIADGRYNFTVIAIDDYPSRESDDAKNVIVDNNPPTIDSILPEDNHANQSSNINFTYTPSDVTLINCSLNGSGSNGIFEVIDTSPTNNAENSFTQTSLSEGIYMWNISCKDILNRKKVSSNRNLTIDQTSPVLDIGVSNGVEYGEE